MRVPAVSRHVSVPVSGRTADAVLLGGVPRSPPGQALAGDTQDTPRQASRRSWRIGQTRPVKVIYMAYRNTLQADALKLVAKKLQSSLAVEGELPEDGLAAFGDDGDDMMLALARQIVSGEEDADAESVEEVFTQAREAEAESEEYLVDDGWKAVEAEPEPVIVEVHGNGFNSNGQSVEPVVVNGNGSGDGHPEEPTAGQQSLFSWAEFLAEEPARSQGRNGKPKPWSLSLFEWALNAEQGAPRHAA